MLYPRHQSASPRGFGAIVRLGWPLLLGLFALAGSGAAETSFTFTESQAFLQTYCRGCHEGKSPAGGFALAWPPGA